MFTSILGNSATLSVTNALLCSGASLVLGLMIMLTYRFCGSCSKSFMVSLCVLPILVQAVIMMVNGNLGTGVAILGAFSLVRFRSVPGSSKEICAVFFAMAVGLATGMGYLTFAALLTVVVALVWLLLCNTPLVTSGANHRELRILIPEDLDYTDVFADIFTQYTKKHILQMIKTTNMGSMFELHYQIELKNQSTEKAMLDAIRCRNGNLRVSVSRSTGAAMEL